MKIEFFFPINIFCKFLCHLVKIFIFLNNTYMLASFRVFKKVWKNAGKVIYHLVGQNVGWRLILCKNELIFLNFKSPDWPNFYVFCALPFSPIQKTLGGHKWWIRSDQTWKYAQPIHKVGHKKKVNFFSITLYLALVVTL